MPAAGEPFALIAPDRGVPRLTAVDPAAAAAGLQIGLSLADARAILPSLQVRDAEPLADARALEALGFWCDRYTPWVMLDSADGLALDLTGCAHLFGGEAGVLDDLGRRLKGFGLTARLAIAGRLPAAWAWARYGATGILPDERVDDRLAALPVRALGIDADAAQALARLGLRRIGDLGPMPRAALLTRFGAGLVTRLDRLRGHAEAPFVALKPPARFAARLGWPEPIGTTGAIAEAVRVLLESVCDELERAQAGARHVSLGLWRLDGRVVSIEVGTSRPVREPSHLFRLLALDLDGLDVGFGIEFMRLEATETTPLGAEQAGLAAAEDEGALAALLDQLGTRLGRDAVARPVPVDSHVPERAQRLAGPEEVAAPGAWPATPPRPLRLFRQPEPAAAMAEIPDGPPARLTWRGVGYVALACSGAERILPEWWRPDDSPAANRDYYRVTIADGRTLWAVREGAWDDPAPPRWRVHGTFD